MKPNADRRKALKSKIGMATWEVVVNGTKSPLHLIRRRMK
jgi:hypothetical protein